MRQAKQLLQYDLIIHTRQIELVRTLWVFLTEKLNLTVSSGVYLTAAILTIDLELCVRVVVVGVHKETYANETDCAAFD